MKKLFTLIIVYIIYSNCLFSQEINFGTDVVSRYVWRGLDFGNSPSIQPGLAFSKNGLEIGTWGAFTTDSQASGVDELDLYLSYSFSLGASEVSLLLTDYYFPNSGLKFGNFNNYDDEDGAGAHILELGVSFTLGQKIPITVSAYSNFYNDEDNSMYFEVGYNKTLEDISLDLFLGGTSGGDNKYYGTENFNLINIGIKVARDIKISESFSLPFYGSYIINPNLEISYFVVGISI